MGRRGNRGAVKSVRRQIEETGKSFTMVEVASKLGKRGNQGAVKSVGRQIKETGKSFTTAVVFRRWNKLKESSGITKPLPLNSGKRISVRK